MTEEMIEEIEAAVAERTGGWVFRINQDADEADPDRPQSIAFGVVIVDGRGNAVTVECSIADDGGAQVVTRAYNEGAEPKDPDVFVMPGAVMVTT